MGFIYKITNLVNGKMYIGKTEETIEERFKEHCQEYKLMRASKRPLYRAMKKYGIENFVVELIEYVKINENLEERELYWIAFYDTYYNGYNATKGGDGKRLLDYDLIIKAYQELQNITKTAELCHCSVDSVSKILKANNIEARTALEVNKDYGNKVDLYDKNNNFIKTFISLQDAAREMTGKKNPSHIIDVCKRRRKTACGYIWRYHEDAGVAEQV